jgi:hypothetical protein
MGPPPPGGLPAKRAEDTGMSSEDDGLPRSPPEMSLLHDVGPSTTIKASAACVTECFHQTSHWGQRELLGLCVLLPPPPIPSGDLHEWGKWGIPGHWSHTVGSWTLFIFILRVEIQVWLGDKVLVTSFLWWYGRSDTVKPLRHFSFLSRWQDPESI